MVALEIVRASNGKLRELGPGLVALFVGGTSGIGEYTLKAFVENTVSPRVYLVGRNTTAAEQIIKDCQDLNKDGKVEFLKADVTELAEVDRICKELEKREKHINLIVQSQGNFNLNGRNESPEGIDRKFTLNFYSRMRFITNLIPLLRNATTVAPHFSRTVSILGAGTESGINLDDLELKNTFSGARCAAHTIVMNDFMAEEFAAREPGTTFVHSFPSLVMTGIARELPLWARVGIKAFSLLLKPFTVGREETGQRQLFHATSGIYPPAKPAANAPTASGVPVPESLEISKGSNGQIASGGYIVNWNGDITGKTQLLSDYRQKGVGKTIWEHTMGIFERVEKINRERASVGTV